MARQKLIPALLAFSLGATTQAWSATLCAGTPSGDVPVEVTSTMSAINPSVTRHVYQLTGLDANGKVITTAGGAVITNYITNSDIDDLTASQPAAFVFNTDGNGILVKTMNLDHTNAQVASTLTGNHLRTNLDGTGVPQALEGGGNGTDIIYTNLLSPGACVTTNISNQHFVVATGFDASGIPTTNGTLDPKVGKHLIAIAPGDASTWEGAKIYTYYEDGSPSPYPPQEPNDVCQGGLYHKLRMNHAWPYYVAAQRANPACSQASILDLRNGNTYPMGYQTSNHDDWSPDGRQLLVEGSKMGGTQLETIFDSSGNFIPGYYLPKSTANPNGFVDNILGPSGAAAEWCSFYPDQKTALCTAGSGTGGSVGNGLPATCHPLFTIDLTTPTLPARFISCTDGDVTGAYEGLPNARYVYRDGQGLDHLVFRSDKTLYPQMYEVVYTSPTNLGTCNGGINCGSDTTPPSIAITLPADKATVSATATISGTASDDVAVANVAVSIDSAPYSFASGAKNWTSSLDTTRLSNGPHKIIATATDSSGNILSTAITVTVSNASNPDTTQPTIAIVSPVNSQTVSGTITVSGTANDDVLVSSVAVALGVGNVTGPYNLATGTGAWSYVLNTNLYSNGNITITAKATDSSGNVNTTIIQVAVSNSGSGDTTPPAVAIASPINNATVSGIITISGTSSDDTAVSQVQITTDGTHFNAASSTANWTYLLDTTALNNGSLTITAKAIDASNNSASTSTLVTVSNSSVTVSSSAATPLTDFGPNQLYLGKFPGLLYDNGNALAPGSPHDLDGLAAAAQVTPLDSTGKPSSAGKIGVVALGMSNWTDEVCRTDPTAGPCVSGTFMGQASSSTQVNHATTVLADCAQVSHDAKTWVDDSNGSYSVCDSTRLPLVGLTPQQVEVILWKDADGGPSVPLSSNTICSPSSSEDACQYLGYVGKIARFVKSHYPNAKQMFVHSRIYAGYAAVALNPEPFAYEYGFATKWLVAAQIHQLAGSPSDPTAGDLSYSTAPWIAWGPYFWANGTTPRSDGMVWCNGQAGSPCNGENDYESDGTHPSSFGDQKVGNMMMSFYLTSAYTSWFRTASSPPTIAITAPLAGSTVSGALTIFGTAADNVNVSSVGVSIDGGAYALATGTATWSFSLDTTGLGNAAHTITAQATDASSNASAPVSISVTVSNSSGGGACSTGTVALTYNAITDTKVYSEPPLPALGSAGTTFNDPTFGSKLLRVTDANTDASRTSQSYRTPAGGEANTWNTASTMFLINGGYLFTFNPSTMGLGRPASGGLLPAALGAAAQWSYLDSDLVYGSNDTPPFRISSYRVSAGSTTLLNDSSLCPGMVTQSGYMGDLDVSKDDQRIMTSMNGIQDTWNILYIYDKTLGCRWWNTSTGQVGGQWGPTGTINTINGYNHLDTFGMHNARISKDGQWVKVSMGQAISVSTAGTGLYFWNIGTLSAILLNQAQGHQALGYGILLLQNNGGYDIRNLNLTNISTYTYLMNPPVFDYNGDDGHLSWNNAQPSVLVPMCNTNYRTDSGPAAAYRENEVDCVATDGSGTLWRFAHHRSLYENSFWNGPHGNVSQDGRFYMFTSNWGLTLGTDPFSANAPRQDVFVVQLAAASSGGICGGSAPVISSVTASTVGSSSATIAWVTDETATSQVQYGLTTAYGSATALDGNLVTLHSVALTALSAGTLYHYRVLSSSSAAAAASLSGDFTFTTLSPGSGDATPPAVAITAPAGGAISGTIIISGTAADDVLVSSVQVSIDGAAYNMAAGTATWTSSLDTTKMSNGSHTVTAKATDAAGNSTTASVSISVNNFLIVGWALNPANSAQAIFQLATNLPAFSVAASPLSVQVAMPSGAKSLTLTQLSTAPLTYDDFLASATFTSTDLFSAAGATLAVTVGTQTFVATWDGFLIQPSLGGLVIESSGPAQISVPQEGVTQQAQIAINPMPPDATGARAAAAQKQNLRLLDAGRDIAFASSGTLNSATLTLPFNPSLIPPGRTPADVVVVYFNAATGAWEIQNNVTLVGSAAQTAVTHLSPYATALLMPSAAPGLRNALCYPNPALGGQDPTIRAFVGVVDDVQATAFNVKGRNVFSASVSGAPTGIANGDYYYDIPWPGRKASGIYFVAIHAHVSGVSTIKAVTKCAVVR